MSTKTRVDVNMCQTHLICCVLEVLDAKGVQYKVIELDTDPDGKAVRAEMADLIGRTSVPVSFIYFIRRATHTHTHTHTHTNIYIIYIYIYILNMSTDLLCLIYCVPLVSEGHLDRIHLYWWLQ
jgi:glutaredoxin